MVPAQARHALPIHRREGREASRDIVTVTHRTKTIEGVPCVAVHDQLYLRGQLEERTTDWYSQDSKGNVWYFGENTAELDKHGRVTNTSGTWRAGVHRAKPGIYMPAHPRIGRSSLQEYYKGQAEDHFKVVGLFGTVTGPKTRSTLLTREWTPLEPGVLDHKVYVPASAPCSSRSRRAETSATSSYPSQRAPEDL